MRIVCSGFWHDDNGGDGAIAEGTARLLLERWPDAEIVFLSLLQMDEAALAHSWRHLRSTQPRVQVRGALLPDELSVRHSGRHGPVATVLNGSRWMASLCTEAVRAQAEPLLQNADLLVVVGGSDVYDNPAVAAPFSLARLATVLYPAWVAGRRSVPVVLFGHTVGPFPRRSGRALARRMIPGGARMVTREARSLQVAATLGFGSAVASPDVAFAVEPKASPLVNCIARRLGDRAAGLVVRRHPHLGVDDDTRVVREFARLGRMLLDSGQVDHLAVVVQSRGPIEVEDDRAISRRVVAALPQGRVTLVDHDLAPAELSALYGRLRFVVTVRLHAAILAMTAGTPSFAISYFSTKSSGVMESIGAGDSWCEHDDFNAELVMSRLDRLATRDVILGRVASFRACLRDEVAAWPVGTAVAS